MGAATAPRDSTTPAGPRLPAQRLRLAVLAMLMTSLVATGVSVAAFFVPGAVVAAFLTAVFYVIWIGLNIADRSRRPGRGGAGESAAATAGAASIEEIAASPPDTVLAAERSGMRTGLVIAAPLVPLAVVLAALFVGWRVIAIGAIAFFAIMILMGAPVWLAALEDEIEEEEERIGHRQSSIR